MAGYAREVKRRFRNHSMRTFDDEVVDNIASLASDVELQASSRAWINRIATHKYTYNFSWLGRPIIQLPQDIIAMQEIIWSVKPDLIIETGIAHGGSLIFSASMLELNAVCGGPQDAEVLGVDVDIRAHNRAAIEGHPMAKRISMLQGSSVVAEIIGRVKAKAAKKRRVLVCLDSNHTHDHVLAELEAYAPLTAVGSYCIVFDTIIDDMSVGGFPDRPWGPGDNPKTAVRAFLRSHPEFESDKRIDQKLVISVAPDGYLKRVR